MEESKSPPIERKYAMTRVKAGDYILPDNDGKTIWRLQKYQEDETVTWGDGSPVKGSFWRVLKWKPTTDGVLDLDDWDRFDEWSYGHRTRDEAIQEALTISTRHHPAVPQKDLNLPDGVGIGYVLTQGGPS